ncbi:hypothetical protein [Methylobacterium sp. WL9]|uniref:hypothetical protein n=1 Tax=Methylobacterium sp. WL9 TaxID=2603898 RepID=UPI00164EF13E|nr:hypothetical protein [Methylobacterium sp. WL9]
MIGRSHPLSPAKGIAIGFGISIALWLAIVASVIGMAHDKASRGELPTLAREVTR